MKENVKKLKRVFIAIALLMLVGVVSAVGIDLAVRLNTEASIVSIEEAENLEDVDYILVLGAGIMDDGTPSPMLKERLDEGIELYKRGVCSKIIMSGDHEKTDHDEVNAMKDYASKQGIPSKDIYMDHAGLSTYDSVYRAKEIFNAQKIVVVTQKYHLYRAIHIAKSLGLESHGVDATKTTYSGQAYRETREFLARIKDFLKCMIKPESTYKGDAIPTFADGNYTNDKDYIVVKNIRSSADDKEFELYIGSKNTVARIENIIANAEFTKETCDCVSDYTLSFDSGKEYSLVMGEQIHIVKNDGGQTEEAILDLEDSKFIEELIVRD